MYTIIKANKNNSAAKVKDKIVYENNFIIIIIKKGGFRLHPPI